MSTQEATAPPPGGGGAAPRRSAVWTQLWFWVVIGIAAGVVVGLVTPDFASDLKFLPDIFIQLIKMITAPVIFCTVIVGIASIGSLATAGGIAVRALAYFLLMTLVALGLGLIVVNIVKPGAGFPPIPPDPETLAEAQADVASGSEGGGALEFIENTLLPESFFGPFVENEILRVLVLAILVAAATSMLAPALRKRVVGGIELIAKVIFGMIRLIMFLAPIVAFGGIAYTVGALGGESLGNLLALMVTFWGTCLIFVVVVLGGVSALSGFNVFKLIRMIKDEILIIVGTSSSETVLPRLLAKLESAGASRSTVSMVLPTGYSFNLDGTCIYLTMAALFIAQAGGQDLPWGVQLGLVALMLLTSKGAAGVSGAGLVTGPVRQPGAAICLAHGGGVLPQILPRLDRGSAMADGDAVPPTVRVREMWCDTLTYDAPSLRLSIERFGAGHVLLGTDYPFAARETPAGAVLDDLDDGLRAALGQHNARRLLEVRPRSMGATT